MTGSRITSRPHADDAGVAGKCTLAGLEEDSAWSHPVFLLINKVRDGVTSELIYLLYVDGVPNALPVGRLESRERQAHSTAEPCVKSFDTQPKTIAIRRHTLDAAREHFALCPIG